MSYLTIITITLTVLPSLLLFLYIYTHDEHPEPKGLVLKVAFFGALTAIPVIAVVFGINSVLSQPTDPLLKAAFSAFVEAAIPEEIFKLVVVLLLVYRHPAFDEPFDGIVYCAIASLGFATLENILYVSSGGLSVAIARALTAVPLHAFCGVIMGYYVGRARFSSGLKNAGFWFAALFWPILYHGVYDWTIFSFNNTQNGLFLIGTLASLVWIIAAGVLKMRRLERENVPLLAVYHDVPLSDLQAALPHGVFTEAILPQIREFLDQASPIRYPSAPYGADALDTGGPGLGDALARRATSSVAIPVRRSRGFLGVLMVFSGIIFVSFSSLVLLGLGLNLANPEYAKTDEFYMGSAVAGLVMLLLLVWGFRLFLRGLRRNRTA
jgi:RsiW-degrading membrane proteinase PrsW (M82 family)